MTAPGKHCFSHKKSVANAILECALTRVDYDMLSKKLAYRWANCVAVTEYVFREEGKRTAAIVLMVIPLAPATTVAVAAAEKD